MYRLLTLIAALIYCNVVSAKVAYLPVTTNNIFQPESKKIMVLDLETGIVLKNIYSQTGNFSGSVFLNNSSTKLYAARGMQVIVIDTTSLDIENTFETPSVVVDLFLNSNNENLYYISNNSSKLHVINLATNDITTAVDFNEERISKHWINESLNTVGFLTTPSSGQPTMRIYDIDSMTEKYSSTPETFNIELISSDGVDYFYTDTNTRTLYSRKLFDNSINWTVDATDEHIFSVLSDNENGTITAIGLYHSYRINRNSGAKEIISNQGTQTLPALFGNNFGKIDNNSFLVVNNPVVFCLTGWCSLTSELGVYTINLRENSQPLIYHRSEIGGSTAKGRFIGEKHYLVPIIPIIDKPIYFILLIGLLLLLAYKSQFQRTKIC